MALSILFSTEKRYIVRITFQMNNGMNDYRKWVCKFNHVVFVYLDCVDSTCVSDRFKAAAKSTLSGVER